MTPEHVVRRLESLLGDDPGPDEGVLHVASAWRSPPASLSVLRIGDSTPRSRSDTFLLAAMRARADAVLTTGAILRAEPQATLELPGPAESVRALAVWRREVLGRRCPPIGLVLTSGREIDLGHPFFDGPGRRVVLTGKAQAAVLRRSAPRRVKVIGDPAPGMRRAIDLLRRGEGARTVLVEAGPSAAAGLYAPPAAVDELVLAVWEGLQLPPSVAGGELPPLDRLAALFERRSPPVSVDEASGRWTFQRFRRAPAPVA